MKLGMDEVKPIMYPYYEMVMETNNNDSLGVPLSSRALSYVEKLVTLPFVATVSLISAIAKVIFSVISLPISLIVILAAINKMTFIEACKHTPLFQLNHSALAEGYLALGAIASFVTVLFGGSTIDIKFTIEG